MQKESWKTIGYVGVDSGSLLIGDPCYLDDEKDWNPKLYEKWICGELCESKNGAIQIEELCQFQAVAFKSGLGDGVYEVRAKYKDYGKNIRKRIKEVKIILIEE